MLKKCISCIILLVILLPISTLASANIKARIGNTYYDSLIDAIANASSEDTIVMLSDEILDNTILINKTININLNGKNISAPSVVFLVQGGALNISGKGIIKETEPNYGAIKVIGSMSSNDYKYSLVNVEKDVILEGWSGIFITHESNKSYGINVNFDGTINAVSDISGGSGVGIYVNGFIQDKNNAPIINIFDNAKIYSNGNGLYIAGYSTWYINKAYIQGNESGIGIKSGILNINGATIECNGPDTTPTEGYNNGIKASGTAIQIESNNGYAGNIELNISDGTFTSENSSVIYEYIGKGNTTQVKDINISNGSFISKAGKTVFLLSNSFKNTHTSFISGGEYSSNPDEYLKSGYSSSLKNDLYQVADSAMKEVFSETKIQKNNLLLKVIGTIVTIIIGFITYWKREKIYQIIKK